MQKSELLFDYDDWSIYYTYGGDYIYVDKDTKETKQLELIGTLVYTIDNQPQCSDEILHTLFDNFCCGERITDDYIYYQWFKEIE